MKYDGTNLDAVKQAHRRWAQGGPDAADSDRADFSGADLWGQDLSDMDWFGADFSGADLRHAHLVYASLDGAILTGARWEGANLYAANLTRAIDPPWYPLACPDSGAFIGWKKALLFQEDENAEDREVVVKLLIPEEAQRLSGGTRECRCDRCTVLEIQALDGAVLADEAHPRAAAAVSMHNPGFLYLVGETLVEPHFDPNRWQMLKTGFCFFPTREEAARYYNFGSLRKATRGMTPEEKAHLFYPVYDDSEVIPP